MCKTVNFTWTVFCFFFPIIEGAGVHCNIDYKKTWWFSCVRPEPCDCYLVSTCAINQQLRFFAVLSAPSAALQGPQSTPLPSLNVKAFHHISFSTPHLLFHVFLFSISLNKPPPPVFCHVPVRFPTVFTFSSAEWPQGSPNNNYGRKARSQMGHQWTETRSHFHSQALPGEYSREHREGGGVRGGSTQRGSKWD